MPHDGDAVGTGRHCLFKLIDHRLLIPLGVLLDQLDVVRGRRGPRPVGPSQGRAIALRAPHLHIDDELIVGEGLGRE